MRLYRTSNFSYLTGNRWVEVLRNATSATCAKRAGELEAKGFSTFVTTEA